MPVLIQRQTGLLSPIKHVRKETTVMRVHRRRTLPQQQRAGTLSTTRSTDDALFSTGVQQELASEHHAYLESTLPQIERISMRLLATHRSPASMLTLSLVSVQLTRLSRSEIARKVTIAREETSGPQIRTKVAP